MSTYKLNSEITPKKEWVIGLNKNGEPIYQTEFYTGVTFNESTSLVLEQIPHNIADISEVISVNISLEKNGTLYPMPYYQNGNIVTYCQSISKTHLGIYNKTGWPNYYIHALVTYTKTTD